MPSNDFNGTAAFNYLDLYDMPDDFVVHSALVVGIHKQREGQLTPNPAPMSTIVSWLCGTALGGENGPYSNKFGHRPKFASSYR